VAATAVLRTSPTSKIQGIDFELYGNRSCGADLLATCSPGGAYRVADPGVEKDGLGRTLLIVFLIALGHFDCSLLGMFALLMGKPIYLVGQSFESRRDVGSSRTRKHLENFPIDHNSK
jgi:hypothetical protein